ncbi:pectinesterase inhibitor 8-like [Zingiber officinale]|uniref:pectinesterase inhibitor 8-like n=1 Tax=Zingiber officinale TaxID=94328 RepID=UPI001C4B39AE|nr:pectinesterase inhibitor 8-like [Zingiber officinale]
MERQRTQGLSVSMALLLFHAQMTLPLVEAYVEQTCSEAAKSDPRVNYKFCVDTLYRHRGSTEADTWRLAQIASDLAVNTSEVGKLLIDDMAKKEVRDPDMRRLLNGCSKLYDDMGTAAARAEDNIRARNYGAAKQLLNQDIAMARQCQASFGRAGKGAPAIVTQIDTEAVNLGILAYAITNLLK